MIMQLVQSNPIDSMVLFFGFCFVFLPYASHMPSGTAAGISLGTYSSLWMTEKTLRESMKPSRGIGKSQLFYEGIK